MGKSRSLEGSGLLAKDVERERFSSRLRECLLHQGLVASPTLLANEFNARFAGGAIGMHTSRKWLLGEAIPTQEKLVVLAAMLGVGADWLRFGTAAQRSAAMKLQAASAIKFDRRELALIADIRRLTPFDQALVRVIVTTMRTRTAT